MVTRHEFLAHLHEEIRPRFYLEVGVQYGHSLWMADCPAWGIDPAPLVASQTVRPNHFIFQATSDDFFRDFFVAEEAYNTVGPTPDPLDLAFIDGMHLVEYAARDFVNVVRMGHERTVIAFDDVLPYSQEIATREQPPGDWTGDVWKIINCIPLTVPFCLVDTSPTGILLIPWLPRDLILDHAASIIASSEVNAYVDDEVPRWIIDRTPPIIPPMEALEWLRKARAE